MIAVAARGAGRWMGRVRGGEGDEDADVGKAHAHSVLVNNNIVSRLP